MKNGLVYKTVVAFLIIICLFETSCEKDIAVSLENVKINGLVVQENTVSATIKGVYSYPSALKKIDVYVAENQEMTPAKVFHAILEKTNFTVEIDSLRGLTTYYYCFEFDNGMDQVKSEVRSFVTKDYSKPTVETFPVTDITATAAKGGGKVLHNGDLDILKQGVCWSFSQDFVLENSIGHTEEDLGSNSFYSDITNLESGRTFYVKAYATNSKGTGYGTSEPFTTMSGELDVHTYWPEVIEVHKMKCGGKVINNGGDEVASKGVCWSLHEIPTINDNKTNEGPGEGVFTSEMNNLYADTTYYIRAYAINSLNQPYYGSEIAVRTLSGKAKVITKEINNVTTNSARGSGEVVSDGGLEVIRRGICWSTGQQPQIGGHYQDAAHGGIGEFLCEIENLRKDQKYYARAYAVNVENQVFYGDTISFKTRSGIPEILINSVQPGVNEALCRYYVYSGNGLEVLHHGLCWSSTNNHPDLNNNEGYHEVGSGTSSSPFSYTIQGLTPGKTYYVRAYATNQDDTYYTDSDSFTTYSGQAAIINFKVIKIKSASAHCEAYVDKVGGFPHTIDDKGVCWGTQHEPSYSANNPNQYSNGAGTGSIYYTIQDLVPETQYYVRVYVRHDGTVQYSEEIPFKTTKEGGLPGAFSVGQDKQVCFSQSNLKYKSQHWTFADDQWDVYGNNGQGSSSQTVNRDLFGWGTSGYNHNNNCYQPWSTSTDNAKYYAYGHPDWNLYDGEGNADWGYNSISHGGNQEQSGWRTLKKSEWVYLFVNRTNAQQKLSQGTVVDVPGMILLPDDWSLPAGLTFVPKAGNWTTNTYTQDQWELMEAHGAVFLPAAGCRTGTSVEKVGTHGYYWSSSLSDGTTAYVMTFNSSAYESQHPSERSVGRSVRLVKNL